MIAFVQENFQGGTMREKQNAKMRFEFPQQEGQSLAQMFGFIEVRSAIDPRGAHQVPEEWRPVTRVMCNADIDERDFV